MPTIFETDWGIIEERIRDNEHTVAQITVFPQQIVPPHFHSRITETYIGREGHGVVFLDTEMTNLEPGSEIVILAGTVHVTLNIHKEGNLIFNAICRGPYDPNDDHIVDYPEGIQQLINQQI